MERNTRRVLTGRVISDKMDKTIVVLVETDKKDSLYGKNTTVAKKYKVHDADEVANVGDLVEIMETRPLSATKNFRLVKVVKKAVVL